MVPDQCQGCALCWANGWAFGPKSLSQLDTHLAGLPITLTAGYLKEASYEMTLQALLGIELPIIQAPMAGVQGRALAVAVCNAGGLGSLPCATLGPDALRKELAAIRSQTTKPFNVNFFCHAQPEPDVERETAWRAALAPYFAEYGIDAGAVAAGPARAPFSAEAAEVLSEFKPPVVSFHFGLPSAELLAKVRAWDAKILSSATTLDEALWLEAGGVDAVIAQGNEAGGHRGMFLSEDLNTQIGTFALVPQVARAIEIPVIAAGGIADARGTAAAMALARLAYRWARATCCARKPAQVRCIGRLSRAKRHA